MSEQRSSFWPWFSGVVFGATAGAAAMFFLSPRSGKANRQYLKNRVDEFSDYVQEEKAAFDDKIEEIFGDVNALTTALYKDARRLWDNQVRSFEKSLDKIDKAKYQEMVDNVMEKLQVSKKYASDDLSKIKRYLNGQWRKFSSMVG